MSKYFLKRHIQTELYKYMILCFLVTFKSSLVDKPLRPVEHTVEKSSIKVVSTLEIRKKKQKREPRRQQGTVIIQNVQGLHIVSLDAQGKILLKDADRQELQEISANYGHLTEF